MSAPILIIEDNERNLYMLTFLLERSGFVVVSAQDGLRGIELAEQVIPSLVLLDIQLPTMDGYAVARRLRESPGLTHIPIVAVTSYAMPEDRERALSAGCNGYVEKPIDPASFVDRIRAFL